MQNYGDRIPLSFPRGEGVWLFDASGERYLDFFSGIAVNLLGHSHPVLQKAIFEAGKKPLHFSNLFEIPEQELCAKKLCSLAENSFQNEYKAFFCNSGTEANEAALKLARKKTGRTKLLSFEGGFHGRTCGSLSITGKEEIRRDFSPLLPDCKKLSFGSLEDISRIDEKTAAVFVELIQGEGGVLPAEKEWISSLQKRCHEVGALFIVDEVQTGVGRTGTFFTSEDYGISPDIITLAKGLGGGLPVGAMLAKKDISAAFTPGSHGTTFGGNPFIMHAVNALIDEVSSSNFLDSVQKNSEYFFSELRILQEEFPNFISEVRGKGFLLGLLLHAKISAADLQKKLREKKVLVITATGNVLRILPPLITTKENIDYFLGVLKSVLSEEIH